MKICLSISFIYLFVMNNYKVCSKKTKIKGHLSKDDLKLIIMGEIYIFLLSNEDRNMKFCRMLVLWRRSKKK